MWLVTFSKWCRCWSWLLSTSCCKIILSNQILQEKLRNRSWVIEMQVWAYEYHTYFQLAHSNTVKFLHWLRIRSKANHEFLRLSTTPQILNESSHSHDRPHGFFSNRIICRLEQVRHEPPSKCIKMLHALTLKWVPGNFRGCWPFRNSPQARP